MTLRLPGTMVLMDTVLAVREGNCSRTPSLGCNDDYDPRHELRSELTKVPVQAGVRYYVIVEGYGDDTVGYELQVTPERWQKIQTTRAPSARRGHAMAYSAEAQKTVLFGGFSKRGFFGHLNQDDVVLGDTWLWDGATWENVTADGDPPARGGHCMAYDSERNVVVMFGGYDGTQALSDTWVWNGSWDGPLEPENSPTARRECGMVYDLTQGYTLLFGGVLPDARYPDDESTWTYYGETWSWNGTNWSMISQADGLRMAAVGFAHDSAQRVSVMFGGLDESTYGNLTQLDGASSTTSNDPTRLSHAGAQPWRLMLSITSWCSLAGSLGSRRSPTTRCAGATRGPWWTEFGQK